MKIVILLGILISCGLFSCRRDIYQFNPEQPVVIYKTRDKTLNSVPIYLSEDKRSIIGYPGPGDLSNGKHFLYPIKLKKGYLLAQKKVTPNTVFVNMSFEEYSRLENTLPLDILKKMILDYSPFTEYYECGKFKDYDTELKEIVKLVDRDFEDCVTVY